MRLFPIPPTAPLNARVFRARRYWEASVCGAAAAGIGGAVLFLVVGGVLIGLTGHVGLLSGVLMLIAVAVPLILLPGKVAALWPYATEVEQGKGLRFYARFKEIYVLVEEVDRVKWSWLWTGWVVRLKRRRGLLTGFIIHVAWGRQGRELAEAIERELARK